ncbi:MAG: nucleotide exchange factor GrpE [Bacteroidales bacterium]|nr:nucleotide exchange factor GrpE [Bacteroidales bacterium]
MSQSTNETEKTNETLNEAVNEVANEQVNENTESTQNEETTEASEADKLAAALEELETVKDKYLRLVAEFDNYRKRTLKEKTELILNGGEKVLSTLLPILDDLDRASQNMETSDDVATLKEGVSLIIDKLAKTLAAQGLQKMKAIGEDFNTDFHEAVALIPAQDEAQKNRVIDCVQPGYLLNEKVIRHAKVVVAQ